MSGLLVDDGFSCLSTAWPWVIDLAVKATLLLGGVLALTTLSAGRAPLRHLLGTVGLVCLIALPALTLAIPWHLDVGRVLGFSEPSAEPQSAAPVALLPGVSPRPAALDPTKAVSSPVSAVPAPEEPEAVVTRTDSEAATPTGLDAGDAVGLLLATWAAVAAALLLRVAIDAASMSWQTHNAVGGDGDASRSQTDGTRPPPSLRIS